MVKDDRSLIEGPWTRKAAPRRPSGEPPVFNAPGVVVWTISFLVACFIALAFAPGRFATQLEWAAGVVPLRFLAGPQGNGGVLAMIAPLFAHMALHANLMHIFFNSIWLLIFGAAVARQLGSGTARSGVLPSSLFLSFFLLSGAAGALFYIALNLRDTVLLVGASGGVSGLFAATLRIMLGGRGYFAPGPTRLAPLSDRRLLIWSALILVLNFVFAVYGSVFSPGAPNVAWEAHMGGFVFGLLAFPLFDRMARAA